MKKRSSTEKKAYGSIAAVIILFTMLAITTYALISAIVGVDGNIFETGTVDIEPGYSAKKDFTVENKGTADVYYRLYLENVSGSLTDSLSFEIYDGDVLLFSGSAGEFTRETPCINSKVLEAGKTDTLTAVVKMEESAGNTYQDAGITFDITADAVQAKNNQDISFE